MAVQETAFACRMASVNVAVVSLDQIVLEKLVQLTATVSLEEVTDFARPFSLLQNLTQFHFRKVHQLQVRV